MHARLARALLWAMLAAVTAAVGACGSPSGQTESTVQVFAAASLGDAFGLLAGGFESSNPGVQVQLNIAGSSSLREQILDGAPADIVALANEATIAQLADAGRLATAPRIFALNVLEIALPVSNPGDVTGLDDLADDSLLVGLCAAGVPCGDLAREVLDVAGVTASVDTNEPDVRALVSRLAAGELDVGLVYASDVIGNDDLIGIEIDPTLNRSSAYPIAVVEGATNPAMAAKFIDYVFSPIGQQTLLARGFAAP